MERRKLNMRVNTYVPCTRFITFAAMRGSISIAVACFACSRIFTVRFPVSGPTSSTLSVSFRLPKQSEYHEEQPGHSFKRTTSTILPYMIHLAQETGAYRWHVWGFWGILRMCWPKRAVLQIGLVTCALSDVDLGAD